MCRLIRYADAPDDIFRRHDNCTCTVTYECGRKRQDVWSKKTWEADPKDVEARIEASEAARPTVKTLAEAQAINEQSKNSITLWRDGDPLPETLDNSETERRYRLEQQQRALEREIRKAKRRAEGFTDPENKAMAQAQLKEKQKDLREFIDKTNADEGTEVLKRDSSREKSSAAELTDNEKDDIIKAEETRKLLRSKIESGELPLTINPDKQKRHILPEGASEMPDGRSHLNISTQEAQEEIIKRHLTGDIHVRISPSGIQFKETIESDRDIFFDARSKTISNRATIHYSKTGTHLVPAKRRDKN